MTHDWYHTYKLLSFLSLKLRLRSYEIWKELGLYCFYLLLERASWGYRHLGTLLQNELVSNLLFYPVATSAWTQISNCNEWMVTFAHKPRDQLNFCDFWVHSKTRQAQGLFELLGCGFQFLTKLWKHLSYFLPSDCRLMVIQRHTSSLVSGSTPRGQVELVSSEGAPRSSIHQALWSKSAACGLESARPYWCTVASQEKYVLQLRLSRNYLDSRWIFQEPR